MKTLYLVWNGVLETVQLIDEHNLNEGATIESYLCLDGNGKQFTCAKDMYFHTEREAWEDYLKELKESIKYNETEIFSLQNQNAEFREEISRTELKLQNV